MKVTFDQHIGIFENAVPKEWCEKVINEYETNLNLTKSRQEHEKGIDSLLKKDSHLSLHKTNKGLCEEFSHNMWSTFYPLYEKKYHLKTVITDEIFISDFKLQKTLPTEGYHVWHIEHSPIKNIRNRTMVYTIYLNDVEEGGETEFLVQSKRVYPKQGTLCIFPAYYTHIHRGNPPISGCKYILTGWIESALNNSLLSNE